MLRASYLALFSLLRALRDRHTRATASRLVLTMRRTGMGLTAHKRSTTTIIAQQSHPPSGSAYWLQFDRQAESFLFPSIDLPQRGAEGEQQPAVLSALGKEGPSLHQLRPPASTATERCQAPSVQQVPIDHQELIDAGWSVDCQHVLEQMASHTWPLSSAVRGWNGGAVGADSMLNFVRTWLSLSISFFAPAVEACLHRAGRSTYCTETHEWMTRNFRRAGSRCLTVEAVAKLTFLPRSCYAALQAPRP